MTSRLSTKYGNVGGAWLLVKHKRTSTEDTERSRGSYWYARSRDYQISNSQAPLGSGIDRYKFVVTLKSRD